MYIALRWIALPRNGEDIFLFIFIYLLYGQQIKQITLVKITNKFIKFCARFVILLMWTHPMFTFYLLHFTQKI